MNLTELRDKCERYIDLGHASDTVVITLSQPSVGARAFTNVASFEPGFDFEKGQMRITPLLKVTADDKDRDEPLKPYRVHTSIRSVIKCPKCGSHLRNKDKYCAECGQAIAEGDYIDINMGGL